MAEEFNQRNLLNDTLLKFGSFLDEINLPFILTCGTLLGYIREGHLLDHDHDVDVAVWDEDITSNMTAKIMGNQDFNEYTKGEAGSEISLVNKLTEYIHFDIFTINKKNDKAFFNPREGKCLVWDYDVLDKNKWKKVKFLDREFYIPGKPKTFLREYYGPTWKIPQNVYTWQTAPNYKLLNEI